MGEIYKARDSRLDRTVAIKILSSDFAAEESGRERLKREARAVARLNHPHICALYDVGSQDGTDFLVMELFYLQRDPAAGRYVNDFVAVEISSSPEFSASRPRRLFGRAVSGAVPTRNYDVSDDGRFLILTPYDPPTEKVTELQVILNWFEELELLAPAEN